MYVKHLRQYLVHSKCSRKGHYFIIYGHILLFMGMSIGGYWGTYGRASPRYFQRDNKHMLQKTEFGEAKFSRSGEKKKKKKTQQTDSLSMSWKVC